MLESTREFIRKLEEAEVKYTVGEPTESGKDNVIVSFGGDNMDTIRCILLFDADNESAAVRVFNIVKIPSEKIAKMFITVNALNIKYRFGKFCIDTNDNTVQMEMDVPFRAGSVGPVCLEMLMYSVSICDKAYPELMKAIWS